MSKKDCKSPETMRKEQLAYNAALRNHKFPANPRDQKAVSEARKRNLEKLEARQSLEVAMGRHKGGIAQ